mgnify:FL=1
MKNDAEWKALWPGTKWTNGPDEGRVEVNDGTAYGGTGKAIRILYPKGGMQSGPSGAQWFIDLLGNREELYFSYWVRFDEGFDFVLGGKLPGLGGANSFEDRTNEWSSRLMWRENGKVEFYIHDPASNDYDAGERFWWNTEGYQATFVPGRWHHIEMHVRLNTPCHFDGLVEGWFDGAKAAHYPAFYFRDTPTASMKIAWVFFSTFFGGSSSDIWKASKDEHATFDEFIVSTGRIGYAGMPEDVDADQLPNVWETAHFGSDTAADASADSDQDGQNNLLEYTAATDPANAQDRFICSSSMESAGTIHLGTAGKAGRRYRLQRSSECSTWADVSESILLDADQHLDFYQPVDAGRAFFRINVTTP